MKKLFIVLIAIFMTSTAMVYANNSTIEIVSQDAPACVEAGNVSVEINYSTYRVGFYNKNDYRVTVSYEVWGYDQNGNLRQVGGGTQTIEANGASSTSFSQNYSGYFLKNVRVQKC